MYKFIIFFLLVIAKPLFSQAPQQISYQGVARTSSGTVISNTTIAVKFDLHQGSASGAIVFSEQYQGATALTTNSFGLFTAAIGSQTSMNAINWAEGPYFIEVLIDPANGTSYHSVGTQQLMSVPYAMYAAKAGNAAPTPTITINSPNTVTNTSAGTYSIHVPEATTYSAGNGISISNGVITNTLSGTSTTVTGSGQAIISSPSANVYNVSVPTPTLSLSGYSLSISSGNEILLPESQLTTGNPNMSINKAGHDYTLTAVTPTLNVIGGTLTGAYPTQTLTISGGSTSLAQGANVTLDQAGNTYTVSAVTPTLNVIGGTLSGAYPTQTLTISGGSTSLSQGANVTLDQAGNSYTVSAVTPTLNVSGGTLTGSYPTQTLTIPSSSTTLASGTNVTVNQSGNTYTVSAVTPTLNVSGGTLTGSYPTQTLTIPSSSTTLASGTNVTVNQSGNTYTVSAVTPTLNVSGGTLTGSYPTQTLTIPSSSTTLASGTNVTVNQSGNTYTVSAVTPTLNVSGGTLTGSYPTQTLTIPSSSTTLVQGTNISLNQSGNTFTISSTTPTLTAGTNVTITPTGAANAYTINAGVTVYSGTSGNIAVSGNTINLAATGVTAGSYGAAATNAVPYFTVDNFGRLTTAGQYTPSILGDVTGNQNASVVSKIRGINVSATAPTNGQTLLFNGTAWTPTTAATPWSLTGNAGTTSSHFIGTTDNQPFRISTNNTVKAVFTETGQLVVGNTSGYAANSKLVVFDGHIESKQTTAPAIAGAGSLLGLLGSSASLSANSTDVRGTIAINLGLLGGAKGDYAAITFNKPYGTPPVIILTPRSEGAALLSAYVTGTTTTGFTLSFSTSTSGGFAVYEFNYMIIE